MILMLNITEQSSSARIDHEGTLIERSRAGTRGRMSEMVTLELPDALVQSARSEADRTHRRIEDVLVEWLDRAATDIPIDGFPDDQLLALSDLQMSDAQQAELSDLLAAQREGALNQIERAQLASLMESYRRGMVRKARALQVAVERGLHAPLD